GSPGQRTIRLGSTMDKSFASSLSTLHDWRLAVQEAARKVAAELPNGCDLAMLFVTELYPGLEPAMLSTLIAEFLPCRTLIGCNSSGVISGGREVEMEPAVTLMGMSLPGVRLTPFYVAPSELAELDGGESLMRRLDIYPTERPKFLAFGDPMTCDAEKWVRLFNEAYPGAPVI